MSTAVSLNSLVEDRALRWPNAAMQHTQGLGNLPLELLHKILAYLNWCEQAEVSATCRTCTQMVRSGIAARRSIQSIKTSDSGLHWLIQRADVTALVGLDISGASQIRSLGCLEVLRTPSLTHLGLSGCRLLEEQSLVRFLQHGRQSLTSLDVSGCSRLGVLAVTAVADNVPSLVLLDASGISSAIAFDAGLAQALLGGCPMLEALRLDGLGRVGAETFQTILACRSSVAAAAPVATRPARLSLSLIGAGQWNLHSPTRAPVLASPQTFFLPRGCAHALSGLGLQPAVSAAVQPGSLCHLAGDSGFRYLRWLDVTGCDRLTDSEIAGALNAGQLPVLRSFSAQATELGDLSLAALSENCPNLAQVDVSACFCVTDAGVVALCGGGNCSVGGGEGAVSVTSGGNIRVCNLRDLRLTACTKLTNAAAEVIMQADKRARACGQLGFINVNAGGCCKRFRSALACLPWNVLRAASRGAKHRKLAPKVRARIAGGCSIIWTGTKCVRQNAYSCIDCGLTGRFVCCAVCAQRCHRNHRVVSVPSMRKCYCDCALTGCQCVAMKRDLLEIDLL